jgi:hypothetical protein
MSKRSPDFTHENAARARQALKEMHDAVAMLYHHKKHLEQFELIDNFLMQAQRFAPFEDTVKNAQENKT